MTARTSGDPVQPGQSRVFPVVTARSPCWRGSSTGALVCLACGVCSRAGLFPASGVPSLLLFALGGRGDFLPSFLALNRRRYRGSPLVSVDLVLDQAEDVGDMALVGPAWFQGNDTAALLTDQPVLRLVVH